MDTVREMLLWMEEQETPFFSLSDTPIFDTREKTHGHIALLLSGGFIHDKDGHSYRMSWEGHEFLDKIRDPEIWSKTKEGASKLGSWSVKLLGEMATGYIKIKATELGLPIS